MAILGVNYQTFDGGLLYKGNLKTKNGCPAKIVVHNSACAAGAFATADYNKFETESGKRTAFAHYYCDDKNVVQLARENWIAHHCGNKEINAMSIGIEICVNPMNCDHKTKKTGFCDLKKCAKLSGLSTKICQKEQDAIRRFYEAEKVAIDLVESLMVKYDLTVDDVLFHSECARKECPFFTMKLHGISHGKDFLRIFNK